MSPTLKAVEKLLEAEVGSALSVTEFVESLQGVPYQVLREECR